MLPIALESICKAAGGVALRGPQQGADNPLSGMVGSICTDTRQLEPNCLFVALRGERFDGHNFLAEAAAKGAIAAVVDEAPEQLPDGLQIIRVSDTRRALGKIASHLRQRLTGTVIGVAGSNGKTSTKHLIDAALKGRLRGTISPKSFNNDIGVPLAIFPADPSQDYLVLEMGTNHPGEIRVLTRMAEPDIAVITNCGPEHLEFLGDLAGVRRENASIIEGLNPRGTLIVNGDDDELVRAVSRFGGRIITFGLEAHNDLVAGNIRCGLDGTRFTWTVVDVFVPMLGRHSAVNALAAIAVGRQLGLEIQDIVDGLAKATGPEMRLQLQRVGGVTVVNDAYNANPASVRAALGTLKELDATRRIAVLGDMRELGDGGPEMHRQIGIYAGECGLSALLCVGELSKYTANGAREAGVNAEHFSDAASAGARLRELVTDGDLVLIKASRAMKLEESLKSLAGEGGRDR
jgi:UDP-N-acetylmuramoyl-tripeptide--D-alanyl-D-alanine ligase